MSDQKIKILFGFLSFGLLASLLYKLTAVPGGMILPGLILGGIFIVGIVIVSLILSGLLMFLFKKASYLSLVSITTCLGFLAFHYHIYSPTLKIIVPNDYKGQINLVLSNLDENILLVDSNGIGYLNKWTFNKTYTRPHVFQINGKDLNKNLVGFNPSSFFGRSVGSGLQILSFEIVPDDKIGENSIILKA